MMRRSHASRVNEMVLVLSYICVTGDLKKEKKTLQTLTNTSGPDSNLDLQQTYSMACNIMVGCSS